MKNQLLVMISMVIILCSGNLRAQDFIIPETNKTLIMKMTADWCGPCGGWGWKLFDSFVHEYETGELNALPVAVHTSSSHDSTLNCGAATGYFLANMDGSMTGIPSFSVDYRLNFGLGEPMRDEVKKRTSSQTIVNTGFKTSIKGDSMTVITKTKFFRRANGDYSVAIYFYEDDIMSYQYPRGDSAIHKKVLRVPEHLDFFTVWGKKLDGNSFPTGHTIDDTTVIKISDEWDSKHLQAFVVIWRKDGSQYKVINVNEVPTFPLNVSNINENTANIKLIPNPAANDLRLRIDTEKPSALSIKITDVTGRTVLSQAASSSKGDVKLNTSLLANGLYNVIVTGDDIQLSERLVISR